MRSARARTSILFLTMSLFGSTAGAVPFAAPGLTLTEFASGNDLFLLDGLTFDGAGNLWGVNENIPGPVWRFASDGSRVEMASLRRPDQIEYDALRDVLYVSEEGGAGNSRILQLSTAGAVTTLVPTGVLNNPEGMAIDPISGDLFIAEDLVNGRILRLDLTTLVLSTFIDATAGLQRVEGLAFDESGTLFATETLTGRILEIDTSGNIGVLIDTALGMNEPDNILFDALSGLLYVSEDAFFPALGRVWSVDPSAADPTASASVIAGDLWAPQGMVFSADHTLYLSEQLSGLLGVPTLWTITGLPVPEPSSALLFAAALGALALRFRSATAAISRTLR